MWNSFRCERLTKSRNRVTNKRLVLRFTMFWILISIIYRLFAFEAQTEDDCPPISIISPIMPFTDGNIRNQQLQALHSWLLLEPISRVYLIIKDKQTISSLKGMIESMNKVTFITSFQRGFHGIPLFHSLINIATSIQSRGIIVFINSDIVLQRDFVECVHYLERFYKNKGRNWFAAGARHDLTVRSDNATNNINRNLNISMHTSGGIDVFAWQAGTNLLKTAIPPFIWGRSRYDNWFLNQILVDGFLDVYDISSASTVIHVQHSRSHVDGLDADRSQDSGVNPWTTNKHSNWEVFVNNYLSYRYGNYDGMSGTHRHAKFKLTRCIDHGLCILERKRPGVCPCEDSPFALHTNNDPKTVRQQYICGSISRYHSDDFALDPYGIHFSRSIAGLPHKLEHLLNKVSRNGTVMVTGCSKGYEVLSMNLVCNMQKFDVHVLVIAFDDICWRYMFQRSVAVYNFQEKSLLNISGPCEFGTSCFKNLTKLKSRAVRELLNYGYSILWSDADIVYNKNPIPYIQSQQFSRQDGVGLLTSANIVIQSNQPTIDQPLNEVLRMNSGLYHINPDAKIKTAFDRIIQDTLQSTLSEQPSFYYILCGRKGEYRVKERHCYNDELDVMTTFLDLTAFPNGARWDDIAQSKSWIGIHNNWITGTKNKIKRFQASGCISYNNETNLCI